MGRALDAMERMTDRFDRAASLNFTTIARVRGDLTDDRLAVALRQLETRHPLLRCGIDRTGPTPVFVDGAAAPIPIRSESGDERTVEAAICAELDAPGWVDLGPRGRLRVVRHAPQLATLLLTLHHSVSDGSSGILAMRDILTASQGLELGPPLPSPGPVHYLPDAPSDAQAQIESMLSEIAEVGPPQRPRDGQAPPSERHSALQRITLNADETQALASAAKRAGATVQGFLCAALARAVAAEHADPVVLRIGHPVTLRRHLAGRTGAKGQLGDEIGYYVSAVDTAHTLSRQSPQGTVAADITGKLHHALKLDRPLLSGPIAGPKLVAATAAMSDQEFCEFAEQHVMLNALGISNLGHLEQLGVMESIGDLQVEGTSFAVTHSVFSALGGSASTFRGELTLWLRGAIPLLSKAHFDRIAQLTESALREPASASPDT